MPAVYIHVEPEILKWALSQVQVEKLGDELVNNIKQWLDGTKTPTFDQIEKFSKKANIPLGYFFLQTPPEEKIELLEYRTVDSVQLVNPSRNLIDTIYDMESIQDWMRAYRQDMGFDVLPFVGCMKNVNETNTIVNKIRDDLEIDDIWYEHYKNAREAFNFIRGRLETMGIIVMMSGIVGNNTHRVLDINEFRAFAMVDEWAPLIFINAADSEGARLFSLFHEIAHIWIGEDDLFNLRYETEGFRASEVLCNAVAGELMVPKNVFLNKWNEIGTDIYEKIDGLTKYFLCSEVAIARKAMDYNKIGDDVYNNVVQLAINNYNRMKMKKGGNYYNTISSRLDRCFVRALCESISIGRTSYTEAYRLTNTNSKTFFEIVQKFGGVVW